jgi:methylmalonyl-CoA/ethylmalonyl-CoA epimerase
LTVSTVPLFADVNKRTPGSPKALSRRHDGVMNAQHRLEHLRGVPAALFGKIDHVGIAVPDLDAAIAFYRDTFGLVCIHDEVNEEQGVREAMLAVGDGETRIQLLAPLSDTSTIAKFLDRSGPGIQQLAYTVEDIDAVSADLRAKGLRLIYAQPRPGTAGSRVNFIHPKDVGGVLVELVEPAKVTRQ